jgi:hypothetical protein
LPFSHFAESVGQQHIGEERFVEMALVEVIAVVLTSHEGSEDPVKAIALGVVHTEERVKVRDSQPKHSPGTQHTTPLPNNGLYLPVRKVLQHMARVDKLR